MGSYHFHKERQFIFIHLKKKKKKKYGLIYSFYHHYIKLYRGSYHIHILLYIKIVYMHPAKEGIQMLSVYYTIIILNYILYRYNELQY